MSPGDSFSLYVDPVLRPFFHYLHLRRREATPSRPPSAVVSALFPTAYLFFVVSRVPRETLPSPSVPGLQVFPPACRKPFRRRIPLSLDLAPSRFSCQDVKRGLRPPAFSALPLEATSPYPFSKHDPCGVQALLLPDPSEFRVFPPRRLALGPDCSRNPRTRTPFFPGLLIVSTFSPSGFLPH